jgi:hypothetical protein
MAFWNKSDDPWDRKPEKRPPATAPEEPPQPRQSPLDTLKGWSEKCKEAASPETPPELCPRCHAPMVQGYLAGGNGIWWRQGSPDWKGRLLVPIFDGDARQVDDEGGLLPYKTAWCCPTCKKLVLDLPEPAGFDHTEEDGGRRRPSRKEEDTL